MFDRVGFVMLVGPGEGAMAVDSLRWALKLYPGTRAWVRDDATSDDTFAQLSEFAHAHPGRVFLQRNSVPEGYRGIAVSMFRMYDAMWRAGHQFEMLIELDPDTCILRTGVVEYARAKFAGCGPGMIGSYTVSPEGKKRDYGTHRRDIFLDLLPVGVDKKTRRVRLGFPFYMKDLWRARSCGYRLGEHVLAAFYVMHGDTFRTLGERGFWSSMPNEGSRYVKEDDVLISLGVKSIGHSLFDINDPKNGIVRAWLQWRPPVKHSAEELWINEYFAVHPLKRDKASQELRQHLRQLAG
jgi:hypothetical protein